MSQQSAGEERHIVYRGYRILVVLNVDNGEWTYRLFIDGELMLDSPTMKAYTELERAFTHARNRARSLIHCRAQ